MIYLCLIVAAIVLAAAIVYRSIMFPPKPLSCGNGDTKIACVGDSITYSLGVVGRRKKYSYPALLAQRLGADYRTVNYGLSDRTLLSTADKPYFAEKLGKAAWDTDADIVIFMLGSNDCKRKNWDAAQFRTEYSAVIRHYLDAGKRLIVMTPPKFFYENPGKSGYDAAILRDELRPIIGALAEQYAVPHVDLYALTEQHPEWFPDKIHPNKAGNVAMADRIAEALSEAEQAQ